MLENEKLDDLSRLLKEMTQLKASDSKLVPPRIMQGLKYSPIGLLFSSLGLALLGLTKGNALELRLRDFMMLGLLSSGSSLLSSSFR